jgi:short-subunit dehydrogenase
MMEQPTLTKSDGDRPFAVITGASRGIGAEYARALAACGYDLLLVARDETALHSLAESLAEESRQAVETAVIDLAEPGGAQQLYLAAQSQRSHVDLLVNNAGFGFFGEFATMSPASLEAMLHLHVVTVVETIRLVLPDMIARRSGGIITVASVAGFLPIPYMAAYGATKTFVIAFSQSLAEEVRPYGVHIQACCPGSTATEFHRRAGSAPHDPVGLQSPSEVVRVSLSRLGSGPVVVPTGFTGRIMRAVCPLVPDRLWARLAGWWIHRSLPGRSKSEHPSIRA